MNFQLLMGQIFAESKWVNGIVWNYHHLQCKFDLSILKFFYGRNFFLESRSAVVISQQCSLVQTHQNITNKQKACERFFFYSLKIFFIFFPFSAVLHVVCAENFSMILLIIRYVIFYSSGDVLNSCCIIPMIIVSFLPVLMRFSLIFFFCRYFVTT